MVLKEVFLCYTVIMYDVIIIGAGIAGMTAGIYLGRAGKTVLLLESKVCGGQIVNALKVDNWPGDQGVSGVKLTEKIYHQVNNFGIKIEYEEVVDIEKKGERDFVVKTDSGEYRCKAVIVATGTKSRQLGSKQAKEAGERPISYCAVCDGALYKDKTVVVVGSGNTAKHEINYLRDIAGKVYHIHHDEPIPEDAEAVFVAIGREPDTESVKDLVELNEEGYIVAGEDCVTSQPGVYAAGDCRTKDVRQLVTAAADGAVAAKAAMDYLAQDM